MYDASKIRLELSWRWIEKLKLLLADHDRRRAMGDAGRQYALEHFSVDAQADKLARVLSDAAVA